MRRWVAVWGIAGLVALLADAIVRLSMRAVEAMSHPDLDPAAVAFALVWAPFMVYVEGVRGFQRGFAPRAAVRAVGLAGDRGRGRPFLVAAAPLVCAGLLHATRRRLIASWSVVAGVVCLVLLIAQLPQPWRGLVDLGVVLALSWGLVCVVVEARRTLRGDATATTIAPDFPGAHRARPKAETETI